MQEANKSKLYNRLFIALCAIATALAMVVRLRYLDVPFERDEGEYAYAGQLILKGIAPYLEVFNMKFPGTYLAYAFFNLIFGHSVVAVRVGVLLLQLLQYVFIYKSAKVLFDRYSAWLAPALLALLNISMQAQAINTNAEHFVITFVIIGLYFLIVSRTSTFFNYFWAGLFFSIAVLMKQHAIFFVLMAGALAVINVLKERRLPPFIGLIVGGAAPIAIIVVWLWVSGALPAFRYWCFDYAHQYIGLVAGNKWAGFWNNGGHIFREYPHVIIAAVLGFTLVLYNKEKPVSTKVLLTLFLLASLASIVPGYFFRRHYFILLSPVVSLLAACGVSKLWISAQHIPTGIRVTLLTIFLGSYFVFNTPYCFQWSNKKLLNKMYSNDEPFHGEVQIASFIKSISAPTDRISSVWSEPQIFYYAERMSASPYIYLYPLQEQQPYSAPMTADYIKKTVENHPNILILQGKGWNSATKEDDTLRKFFNNYRKDFELKGVFYLQPTVDGGSNEILLSGNTLVDTSKISGETEILIFKRKNEP